MEEVPNTNIFSTVEKNRCTYSSTYELNMKYPRILLDNELLEKRNYGRVSKAKFTSVKTTSKSLLHI